MTQLEVFNLALDAFGQEKLDSTDAKVPGALALNRQWDAALRRVLRDLMPNWATTQASFDLVTGTPLLKWAYMYEVPSNLVAMVALNETYVTTPSDLWQLYRINGMRLLLTDEESADCEYIYVPSDSDLEDFLDAMDPLGFDAFVTLLASRVAPKVAKDATTMSTALLNKYLTVDLPRARVVVKNEQRQYPKRPSATSLNRVARFTYRNG